ncbi:hypothetical protein PG994_000657 [Apiospora phragmitis]|uniref:Uncharacterized protein n=1 Tax=Apiospora phragmitis TaxID=2905665 RepID=A0ABR1X6Y0_9PEZI
MAKTTLYNKDESSALVQLKVVVRYGADSSEELEETITGPRLMSLMSRISCATGNWGRERALWVAAMTASTPFPAASLPP